MSSRLLEKRGADIGLELCGLHALDSCRIEKAFRHFGHDITDEDHVLEAGLGFAVKTDKGAAGSATSSAATRCCASAMPACRAGWCSSARRPGAAALPQRART